MRASESSQSSLWLQCRIVLIATINKPHVFKLLRLHYLHWRRLHLTHSHIPELKRSRNIQRDLNRGVLAKWDIRSSFPVIAKTYLEISTVQITTRFKMYLMSLCLKIRLHCFCIRRKWYCEALVEMRVAQGRPLCRSGPVSVTLIIPSHLVYAMLRKAVCRCVFYDILFFITAVGRVTIVWMFNRFHACA